jgi:RimJ/RimL family protein N-acetyltransferase
MTRLNVNDDIYLSELSATDQTDCVSHLQSEEIYRRTLRIARPYTDQHFQAFLKIVEETTQKHGRPMHFAFRNRAGSMIGGLGIHFEPGMHRAEIGYWLAREYWGKGIMSQILPVVCAFAFNELGLLKLTAEVFAMNAASARVLQKCGFQQEGELRQHYQKDGELIDAKVFGLLRESWIDAGKRAYL